jgi:hypothetical protein
MFNAFRLKFVQTLTFTEDGLENRKRGHANFFAIMIRDTPLPEVCCEMIASYCVLPIVFWWGPRGFWVDQKLFLSGFLNPQIPKNVEIFKVLAPITTNSCFKCSNTAQNSYEMMIDEKGTHRNEIICCQNHSYLFEWQ